MCDINLEESSYMEGYITINELAERWEVAPRTLQMMCAQGKIPGASKFGSVWAVPRDAEKPKDGRITSGKYRNWRNKTKGKTM